MTSRLQVVARFGAIWTPELVLELVDLLYKASDSEDYREGDDYHADN
ncbi:MAG: hypothetical protein N2508_04480 [Anaerolineae bacterium]|nr:hypothetical protein [Anaerolineae bacterium]